VLKFEVFDWNRSGKHELIGFFTTTIEELSSRVGLTFTLTNPALQAARKNYKVKVLLFAVSESFAFAVLLSPSFFLCASFLVS
jgi:hypothetical protein